MVSRLASRSGHLQDWLLKAIAVAVPQEPPASTAPKIRDCPGDPA